MATSIRELTKLYSGGTSVSDNMPYYEFLWRKCKKYGYDYNDLTEEQAAHLTSLEFRPKPGTLAKTSEKRKEQLARMHAKELPSTYEFHEKAQAVLQEFLQEYPGIAKKLDTPDKRKALLTYAYRQNMDDLLKAYVWYFVPDCDVQHSTVLGGKEKKTRDEMTYGCSLEDYADLLEEQGWHSPRYIEYIREQARIGKEEYRARLSRGVRLGKGRSEGVESELTNWDNISKYLVEWSKENERKEEIDRS